MKQRVWLLLLVCLLLVGCTGVSGNPTPRESLKGEDPDIFYYKKIVYAKVERDEDFTYTIGEEFCEITRKTSKAFLFKDGTANKLPVGTIVYNTDKDGVVAIVDGVEQFYIALIEG